MNKNRFYYRLLPIFLFSQVILITQAIAQEYETDEVDTNPTLPSTPLLPDTQARKRGPVYSQDKFKQFDQTDEIELPKYTQDKFGKKEKKKDYSSELRKTLEMGREKSASHLAKGTLAFEEKKFDQAVVELNQATKEDSKNFLAYEYLGQAHEALKNFPRALESYVRAKHIAPENRFGSINYQIGRIYFNQKNYERAKVYLDLAKAQGGHLVATNYLLGYLKYLEKRYLEAETFFREARVMALKFQASDAEKKLLQPIHYYLGEIYARLGYFDYSISMLNQTEFGDSPELRNTAWRVHAELNESSHGFGGAFAGLYDSNVILLPQTGTLPTEFSSQSGIGTLFQGFGYYQTSPVKKLRFALDGQLQINNYLTSNLSKYDVILMSGAMQADLWDQKEWLGRLRLEALNASVDRSQFNRYESRYGPVLSLRYFPYARWNYEVGTSIQVQNFAKDLTSGPDQRNGYDVGFFLKAFVDGPNPRLKPHLMYSYTVSAANGEDFRAKSHSFEGAVLWAAASDFSLTPSLKYKLIDFPDHLFGRHDSYYEFKLLGAYSLSAAFTIFADATMTSNVSTLNSYRYNREVITMGLSFQY